MSDPVSAALDSVDGTGAPQQDGVSAALDQVQQPQPVTVGQAQAATTQAAPESPWEQAAGWAVAPWETEMHLATSAVAPAVAGVAGLASWPFVGTDRASQLIGRLQNDLTYEPHTPQGQEVSAIEGRVLGSSWDPLNWPDVAGRALGGFAAEHGAPPALSTGLRIAPDAAAALLGSRLIPGAPVRVPMDEGVLPGDVPTPETAAAVARASQGTPGDVPTPETAAAVARASQGAPVASPAPARDPFDEPPPGAPNLEASPAEQARRIRVLNEIGLNGSPVRSSAITGDPLAAGTDAQVAKLDSPAGRQMRATLDNERAGLQNYAGRTTEGTGGRVGGTQTDTMARGESVQGALEGLSDQYRSRIGALYQAADQAAKGVPTELKGFQDVLGDDSLMTNQDRVGLRGGLNAYLRKLGVVDEHGNVTASVSQAETIRKYLNDEWTPQNSKLVGKLKDALDDDVTKDAGSDIYEQARALRAERGATLDNPKGIASLIDASGPNGINRVVPAEGVMGKLETMPVAQLEHVVKTLGGMDGELAPQGQQALSDIRSHFAQRIEDIGGKTEGQWNSRGVNQYLKNNAARLQTVFADRPDLLKRFYTLNEAGKILRYDASYPGAAAQAANLARSGVLPHLIGSGMRLGGAALGATFGPLGAGAGETLGDIFGSRVAGSAAENAALKSAQGRVMRLGQ